MAPQIQTDQNQTLRAVIAFGLLGLGLIAVGILQSWNSAFGVLNLCMISAVMALGLNVQWGYAGLFNAGVMAFAAIGGLTAVLVSHPPVIEAWQAGGTYLIGSLAALIATILLVRFVRPRLPDGPIRFWGTVIITITAYVIIRSLFREGAGLVEAVNPAKTGFLGGLGLPIITSWLIAGFVAGALAWAIGKISLGLRSDYLAIATLGIAEIVIAVIKFEDWLARGVKNVTGLSRPVPYEIDLQESDSFIGWVSWWYQDTLLASDNSAKLLNELVISSSSIFVKLCYSGILLAALLILLALANRAARSPWGRMMRAIRDNEHAASAMGKDVVYRHRQAFIVGSAIVGIGGAMLTTIDGQFTPSSYNPLRFTFIIWVMVIVGGSGNNLGSILGGAIIWFTWVQAEPAAQFVMQNIASFLPEDSALADHLSDIAPHMRLFTMGLVLLLVMRFAPRGILAERR